MPRQCAALTPTSTSTSPWRPSRSSEVRPSPPPSRDSKPSGTTCAPRTGTSSRSARATWSQKPSGRPSSTGGSGASCPRRGRGWRRCSKHECRCRGGHAPSPSRSRPGSSVWQRDPGISTEPAAESVELFRAEARRVRGGARALHPLALLHVGLAAAAPPRGGGPAGGARAARRAGEPDVPRGAAHRAGPRAVPQRRSRRSPLGVRGVPRCRGAGGRSLRRERRRHAGRLGSPRPRRSPPRRVPACARDRDGARQRRRDRVRVRRARRHGRHDRRRRAGRNAARRCGEPAFANRPHGPTRVSLVPARRRRDPRERPGGRLRGCARGGSPDARDMPRWPSPSSPPARCRRREDGGRVRERTPVTVTPCDRSPRRRNRSSRSCSATSRRSCSSASSSRLCRCSARGRLRLQATRASRSPAGDALDERRVPDRADGDVPGSDECGVHDDPLSIAWTRRSRAVEPSHRDADPGHPRSLPRSPTSTTEISRDPVHAESRPSSSAARTASCRDATPSLASTAATWLSTVRTDTTSRSAISAFVRPSARSRAHPPGGRSGPRGCAGSGSTARAGCSGRHGRGGPPGRAVRAGPRRCDRGSRARR